MLEQMDQSLARVWLKKSRLQAICRPFSVGCVQLEQTSVGYKKEGGHQNKPVTTFVNSKSIHSVSAACNRNIPPAILVHTATVAGHANIFHVKPAVVVQVGAD